MFAVPAVATAARAFRAAGLARPVMRAAAASHVATTTPFQVAAPTHHHGARCFSAEVFKGSCHCGECQVEVDGVPNAGVRCCRCCERLRDGGGSCVRHSLTRSHLPVAPRPTPQVICHCSICRLCHSAPYAELLAYDNDKVRVVKGEDKMKMYNIHGKSQEDRYFCPDCGSKVYRCVPSGAQSAAAGVMGASV